MRLYQEPTEEERAEELLRCDMSYDDLYEEDPDDRDYPDDPEAHKYQFKGPGKWLGAPEAINGIEDMLADLRKKSLSLQEKERLRRVKTALKISDDDALWIVIIALEYHLSLYEEIPRKIQEAMDDLLRNAEKEIRRIGQEQVTSQHKALSETRNRMAVQILRKLEEAGNKQLTQLQAQGQEIVDGLSEQAEALSYSHQYPWLPIWVGIAATTSLISLFLVLAMLVRPEWLGIFHA